jgi:SAM-dependent methyltransferase
MNGARMRDFWDKRAREDAYFFIDDRRAYGDPDLDAFWAAGERDLDAILELVGVAIAPTDTVLDIGCGVGRLTRVIARRAARVYGLDVSSEMVSRSRRHNADLANAEWIVGDGMSLRPLADGSVDACVSHVVFQHIPDPRVTLGYVAEMGRVLCPGGWAAFQVSNDPHVHRRRRGRDATLRRLGALVGRHPRGQADPAWLGSAVDMHELRRIAHDSGLELERVLGEGSQFCVVLARRVATAAAAPGPPT